MKRKVTSVEQYLADVDPAKRSALEKLRRAIKAAAPDSEECLVYGVPGFRLGGRYLVGYGVSATHCSFYPGGTALGPFRAELARYETSKGTVRFDPKRGLPATLVRKLVKSRIAALQR